MARFRFRLESLYRYRQHLLEQTEQKLAQLKAEEHQLLQTQHQYRRELEQSSCDGTCIKALSLQWRDAYHQQLREHIQLLEQQLHALRLEQEHYQRQLIERMQQRDVLDRLRDRQFEQFQLQQRRDEQHHLDEVAIRLRCAAPPGRR